MPALRKKSAADCACAVSMACSQTTMHPATARAKRLHIALELAQQAAIAFNLVVDPGGAQRLPEDRLLRGHHVDVELALDLVDRMSGGPVGAAVMDGVGLGMLALDLTRQRDRKLAGDAPKVFDSIAAGDDAGRLDPEIAD